MEYKLIIVIVNKGYSTSVMDAARGASATGGTMIHARGTGSHMAEKLFGVAVQPEKEVIMILSPSSSCDEIMRAVIAKAGLNTLGAGICFSLPVDNVLGIAAGINRGEDAEDAPKQM